MKKVIKSTKKGFTLVELIVVLVVLAILAAMLVPALTGYIKRARQEKDYQFAATVLTAAQSAATYQFSLAKADRSTTIKETTNAGGQSGGVTVADLVGVASTQKTWTCSFSVNSDYVITKGTVTIGDVDYEWDGQNWTAKES